MEKKMKVCVYSGSGAVLAKWVEKALNKLKIPYSNIKEQDIEKGKLKSCSILIIPGGYTPLCVSALTKNYEKIRNFIKNGGKYIGICMGTYLAAKEVEVSYFYGYKPEGLGIINILNRRGKGKGIRKVKICERDRITKGYDKEVNVFCENPPLIIPNKNIRVLAKYANDYAALVTSKYGKGKVILFSFHPERISTTYKMLENAILF